MSNVTRQLPPNLFKQRHPVVQCECLFELLINLPIIFTFHRLGLNCPKTLCDFTAFLNEAVFVAAVINTFTVHASLRPDTNTRSGSREYCECWSQVWIKWRSKAKRGAV